MCLKHLSHGSQKERRKNGQCPVTASQGGHVPRHRSLHKGGPWLTHHKLIRTQGSPSGHRAALPPPSAHSPEGPAGARLAALGARTEVDLGTVGDSWGSSGALGTLMTANRDAFGGPPAETGEMGKRLRAVAVETVGRGPGKVGLGPAVEAKPEAAAG